MGVTKILVTRKFVYWAPEGRSGWPDMFLTLTRREWSIRHCFCYNISRILSSKGITWPCTRHKALQFVIQKAIRCTDLLYRSLSPSPYTLQVIDGICDNTIIGKVSNCDLGRKWCQSDLLNYADSIALDEWSLKTCLVIKKRLLIVRKSSWRSVGSWSHFRWFWLRRIVPLIYFIDICRK